MLKIAFHQKTFDNRSMISLVLFSGGLINIAKVTLEEYLKKIIIVAVWPILLLYVVLS